MNTFAFYALMRSLMSPLAPDGRVVNLSSAAQVRIDQDALHWRKQLTELNVYAQSKLALTVWSHELARELPDGPVIIAVNPGSLLVSKMVKEANILREAALGASFAGVSGKCFGNDSGQFAQPHAAAPDTAHSVDVMQAIKDALAAPR